MVDLFHGCSGEFMWEINSNGQLLGFLYAVITGIFYSLIYDFFKSIRLSFKHKDITVFFEDLIFSFIISVISFLFFLIFTAGEIRIYILLGFLAGFLSWKFTFSNLLVNTFICVLKFLVRVFSYFNNKLSVIFTVFSGFFKKFKKFLKNYQNRLKKLL